ncbi:MAG: DUF2748 family protein [Rickettsia sp.]|nr:DUF2748 family protein [Rickettsia sp.]
MQSVYHVVHKVPTLNLNFLGREKYEIAKTLIQEGLIRIDTNYYCNFVHYVNNNQDIKLTFTEHELCNDKLLNKTQNKIQMAFFKKNLELGEQDVQKILFKQREKLKLINFPPKQLIENLAYLIVQSAHNIIFKWIIKDRVELFISYGRNIGDVMDVMSWKYFGSNSGMQSIDMNKIAIYVSCGGDPFVKNNSKNKLIGDGMAAVARLNIIAAQEIGHFADIKRNVRGQRIGRHSTQYFSAKKADLRVAQYRNLDILRCKNLLQDIDHNFSYMLKYEKNLIYAKKFKNIFLLKKIYYKICLLFGNIKLRRKYLHKENMIFMEKFLSEDFIISSLRVMLKDMLSNLMPKADVYKRSDKLEEEAIACAEALARVPQQVIKWGHLTTKYLISNLYNFYYNEVILDLISKYENLVYEKKKEYSFLEKVKFQLIRFKRTFKFKKLPIIDANNLDKSNFY